MSNSLISFVLRAPGSSCDGREYRRPALPRAGDLFKDDANLVRIHLVLHHAHGGIELFAVPGRLSFAGEGFAGTFVPLTPFAM